MAYTVQNVLLGSQCHDDIIRNQEILNMKMTLYDMIFIQNCQFLIGIRNLMVQDFVGSF